jgi:hypothetical protein
MDCYNSKDRLARRCSPQLSRRACNCHADMQANAQGIVGDVIVLVMLVSGLARVEESYLVV